MADITITPGSVQPTATTQTGRGTAGGTITITQGMPVYADPNASFAIKPAQGNNATGTVAIPNLVGIALDQAAPGQPVTYAVSGDVAFGSILSAGTVYIVSPSNPGSIGLSADINTSGQVMGVLGVATSGSVLHLGVIATLAVKP